ncbi:non-ribosomal peptide synthetase, partial [Pedobacter steynii]|uniref:condensation domain-containing protein n=1 Tax=Pedobacter steynii TaxID=430522 RepID=UPI0020B115AB
GMSAGLEYVAPRNEIEEKLVLIWQEILGREKISVKDNFFELGGHSLKVTRLSGQIHKTFDVRVVLKDIFIAPVLEDQAALIEKATNSSFVAIPLVSPGQSYVLSSSQRRLWILSQFEDGNIAYNMPGVYVFEGDLNIEALEQSFLALIERHENLRTIFREAENSEVQQFILPFESVDFKIGYQDFRSVADRDEVVKGLVAAEFHHSFDLSSYPLLRASLYQLSDHQWVFCYVVQHIISDGWSMGVLIRELLSLYNAFVTGAAMPLVPLRIQYKDYAAWQQSELTGDQLHIHQNYWMNQFSGQLPVLNLPLEKPRPAKRTYNGATISGTINADISEGLRSLIKEEGGTLFMGLVAAMNVLFYRYSGQEDIIIGSPIAGREHADLEDQIGFYINTLALRSRFKGSGDYLELLREVKKVTLDAYDHQVYPFDEVLERLHLKRDMSRNPLFDVMIILQNTSSGHQKILSPSFNIKEYGLDEHTISKYDLSFYFNEIGDELKLSIEYSTDLFSEAAVKRLYGHFESLLAHVVKHPHHSLDDLIYIAEGERAPLFLDEG